MQIQTEHERYGTTHLRGQLHWPPWPANANITNMLRSSSKIKQSFPRSNQSKKWKKKLPFPICFLVTSRQNETLPLPLAFARRQLTHEDYLSIRNTPTSSPSQPGLLERMKTECTKASALCRKSPSLLHS